MADTPNKLPETAPHVVDFIYWAISTLGDLDDGQVKRQMCIDKVEELVNQELSHQKTQLAEKVRELRIDKWAPSSSARYALDDVLALLREDTSENAD